jgi:hypothetical protein
MEKWQKNEAMVMLHWSAGDEDEGGRERWKRANIDGGKDGKMTGGRCKRRAVLIECLPTLE